MKGRIYLNISFDAHPIIEGQKTGIGYCESEMVRSIRRNSPNCAHLLEFFTFRNAAQKRHHLSAFEQAGFILNECSWFSSSLYKLIWSFIPIPYRWFFGKKSEVTHFFNYYVPPGVHGKVVATVHDMAFKVLPETVRFKTKFMLNLTLRSSCKRADKITTVSQFTKEELIKYLHVPEEKIVVVPNGVDLEKFHANESKEEIMAVTKKYNISRNYLLYLGTLEPRKNIVRIIKAYALLKTRLSDAPLLVLAGRKGWMYDLIFQTVSDLDLKDDVTFTGYIEDGEAPALLNGATAFLFPSLYEGFGMPLLEAMACGTPALTSNCSSLPEVAGDVAVLVDPYSVEAIADGMERLVTDDSLRAELSEKGLKRAEQFTWERSAAILMNIYKSLSKTQEKS